MGVLRLGAVPRAHALALLEALLALGLVIPAGGLLAVLQLCKGIKMMIQGISRLLLVAVMILVMNPTVSWAQVIEDDFNDNSIDPTTWTALGSFPQRYAIETNNRLEVRSDGTEDDSAGILLNTSLAVSRDFKIQVDFDSSECSADCVMALGIFNSNDTVEEAIFWGNGHDATHVGTVARSWIAFKMRDDVTVYDEVFQETASSSGTLFLEHSDDAFYLSFTGYGAENAFATLDIDDWTGCSEVNVLLVGVTLYKPLSGSGSFFDDFRLELEGSSPVPSVSDEGLIVLIVLFLGSAIWVMRSKTKQSPA